MKRYFIILFFIFFQFIAFAIDDISGDYLISSVSKIISLDLEEAKLVDVLKMLSQQSGLNFTSTEAVRERKITVYLERVPLKEALDIIFKANNLTYDYYPEANIFVVREMGRPALELKTKVYRLKYARVRSSRTQKEIEKIIDEGKASGSEGDIGIIGAIKKVISEFGKVTEDPLTNSLIVIDVPSQFPIIDEVVKNLDIPIPKVMIEVEMLDVSKKAFEKLGTDWPEMIARLSVNGSRETRFPFGSKTVSGSGRTLEADRGVLSDVWEWGAWDATRFGPSILTVIGADIIVNFLKQNTDAKTLARPKILTLSNETAEIKITADEAIGVTKNVEEREVTYTIDRAETGTKLRVTPQVNPETGEITLFVEMMVKEAKSSGMTTEGLLTGEIKNPEERSERTVMRLHNGETLLIGGLIKQQTNITISKVPILGDIPILNFFFKHKSKPIENNEERELLVFLTPRIMEDSYTYSVSKEDIMREQNYFRKNSINVALDKLSEY